MKQVNPFYRSRAWLRCRLLALQRDHYLCQPCYRGGKFTAANTVHHIEALEKRPDLALELSNLESICPSCHNKEHPEKGRGEKVEEQQRKASILNVKANEEQ